ncbi:MAG: serine hydrolase domain-containing protein, partial [Candidatus Thiodiazotropha sp. 6PLUC5]
RLGVVFVALIFSISACTSVDEKASRGGSLIPGANMAQVRSESLKLIERMLEEEFVPGISVALVNSEGTLWVEGFGDADSRTGELVTADTVFRAGSLSKPVTALGIMQLVADGRVDLDAPLKEQLDMFSIRRRESSAMSVTPRQLLSHRSGLPSDLRKGMYTDTYFTKVTELLRNEYAAYHPNKVYSYSNLGYDLLGHLIETKTSERYAEYMRQNLFEPLGMSSSGFLLTKEMRQQLSSGHLDGQVRPLPPLRDMPALGLYMSARDAGRLMTRILQRDLPGVSAPLIEQMWRPQNVDGEISLGISPGMGWFLQDYANTGRQVRHGGSTLLFGAEMVLLPKHGLGVAVLANGAGSNRMARELATTILTLALMVQGGESHQQPLQLTEQDNPQFETPSGGYATDLGLLMVDPEHPRLCACIIERILDLVRFDDGSLGLTQQSIDSLPDGYRVLGDLRFKSRQQNGMDLLVAHRGEEEIILGNKIESDPWETVWRKRLGSYRTINPDGDFSIQDLHLSEESGVLCLHYRAPHLSESLVRLPLQPVSENEAVIQGFGRGRGETVQIVEINGKQCLKFSGFMGEPINQE